MYHYIPPTKKQAIAGAKTLVKFKKVIDDDIDAFFYECFGKTAAHFLPKYTQTIDRCPGLFMQRLDPGWKVKFCCAGGQDISSCLHGTDFCLAVTSYLDMHTLCEIMGHENGLITWKMHMVSRLCVTAVFAELDDEQLSTLYDILYKNIK